MNTMAEDLAEELANEYLELLTIDTSEQRRKVDEHIEEYLTHLEEAYSVLECCTKKPDVGKLIIHKSQTELEKLYEQIDELEKYVCRLAKTLNDLELSLNELELHNKPTVMDKLRQMIDLKLR